MSSKVKFYSRKLVINTKKSEVSYYYSDLKYASFFNPHCLLNFTDGNEYEVLLSVNDLLKNLPEKTFFQCNRSDIINLGYYEGYNNKNRMVSIEGSHTFELSYRREKNFNEKKETINCLSPQCQICSDDKKGNCRDYCIFKIETVTKETDSSTNLLLIS